MTGKSAVLIDGGYLTKVLDSFGRPKIKFDELSHIMANGQDLLRAYYYHCRPYVGPSPTPEDQQRLASMDNFFKAIQRLPRFQVRLGHLAFRGATVTGEPIFEQKRVDTMMAVDMVTLALRGNVTHLSILTGDSDFIPAIEVAKDHGALVQLWHGQFGTFHRELWEACDERVAITHEVLQSIAMPSKVLCA